MPRDALLRRKMSPSGRGAPRVDRAMRTKLEDVFAAGDRRRLAGRNLIGLAGCAPPASPSASARSAAVAAALAAGLRTVTAAALLDVAHLGAHRHHLLFGW